MIIKTNEVIKISVTNILVKLHIKVGNAVAQVTLVSSAHWLVFTSSIHFPINGTEVFSWIPQHTPGVLHSVQVQFIFLVPLGQEQIRLAHHMVHDLGLSHGVQIKLVLTDWHWASQQDLLHIQLSTKISHETHWRVELFVLQALQSRASLWYGAGSFIPGWEQSHWLIVSHFVVQSAQVAAWV